MDERSIPPVLFEALRSFLALSRTLNVTHAVKELGTTRQTIRRHIDELEALTGQKLFETNNRRYQLTRTGLQSALEAKAIMDKTEAWVKGQLRTVNCLVWTKFSQEDGSRFYAQQHPTNSVWKLGPPLLQDGLQIWATAKSRLEDNAMKKLRPYLVVYRKHRDEWLCVSVGDKSSYATWLGSNWAKSAIGRSFMDDPVNSKMDQFIVQAYDHVSQVGGVWYDHVCTEFLREPCGKAQPANYQRLVFACTFPDGQPAVAALVARTNRLVIDGLDTSKIPAISDDDLMEFEI